MIDAALTVRRARVHGAVDPATAPSHLASVLAGGELVPAGLPPAAVLCVRRLADPAPGVLPLDAGHLRPPPEWERAFVDQLTRLLAAAARPAREPVPADAGAVYFADRAELLACLARDARDGTMWTRWWWRSIAPAGGPRGDPVIEAWISTPQHVPAALALLASRGEAERFVAALPVSVAHELAARVAAAFGAVELERAIMAEFRAAKAAAVASEAARRPPRPAPLERPRVAAAAPWSGLVPEAAVQQIAPARALFLGVALSLRRAPALALRSAFAREVAAWLQPAIEPPRAATVAVPTSTSPVELPAVGAGAPDAPLAPRRRARETPLPRASSPARAAPPEDAPASGVADAAVTESAIASARPAAEPEPVESARAQPVEPPPPEHSARAPLRRGPRPPRAGAPSIARDDPQPPIAVSPPATAAVPEPALAAPEGRDELPVAGVETGLGGVFYLLNLFLYLGLYGDFTSPRQPGIGLDPWECVARVARRLLSRERRGDPVWRILERLAGPHAFRPPPAWRVPRTWLQPFDAEGVWRWSAAHGTLRLAHPAGCTVLAVPRSAERPRAQLDRELKRLRIRPALRRSSLGREPADPLDRWIARLAAYARARLVLALDLDLERELFARHARVFVTDSHVDVVLSLSDLPLAVRFAGLDRTPGFVPAAGRFIAFHFE